MVAAPRIRRRLRAALTAATTAAALAAMLPGCAALIGGEAAVVLQAIEQGPEATALGRTTPPPLRERHPDHDLWRPGGTAPPRAALVLAPGFSEAGRDDPRLIPVADAFARAGFLVMVPELPGARRLTLDSADTAALRRAVGTLAARQDTPRRGDGGVALAAISFAAGPALIAAAEAEPAEVSLLVTLGGFHDMTAAATAAATGAHRAPGEAAWRRDLAPSPWAGAAFLVAIAEALPDQGDRWFARAAAGRLLDDAEAPLDDLAAGMTPQGRSALALVTERDPDRIPDRLAALPAPAREALAALDPSRHDLSGLRACVVAIHGEADPIIPWTQSAALAAALPPGRVRLFLVPGFGHVEPAAVPTEGQLVLLSAMRAILGWRDGADPCGG